MPFGVRLSSCQEFLYRPAGDTEAYTAPPVGAQEVLEMPRAIRDLISILKSLVSRPHVGFNRSVISSMYIFKHKYFNIYVFMCLYP